SLVLEVWVCWKSGEFVAGAEVEVAADPPCPPLLRGGERFLMVDYEFLGVEERPEEAPQSCGRRGGVVDEFRGPLEFARFGDPAQRSQIRLADQVGPVKLRDALRF